jgi:hypothetical protein
VTYTIDVRAILDVPRRLSDDEIADLILHVSGLLDPVSIDPLVTLIREGDGLLVHNPCRAAARRHADRLSERFEKYARLNNTTHHSVHLSGIIHDHLAGGITPFQSFIR